jgi:two-component system LytT family response regulator
VEIVAECADGAQALKETQKRRPDLLFLDVQMPKLDGFEVLELISGDVAVVFVTAYDQYAMKAFDAAALDYLLKPFDQGRFRTALDRIRRRLSERVHIVNASELKNAAKAPGQYTQRIVVKDGTRVHIIPSDQLDYAEAQDDYVALQSGGKSYLKRSTQRALCGCTARLSSTWSASRKLSLTPETPGLRFWPAEHRSRSAARDSCD